MNALALVMLLAVAEPPTAVQSHEEEPTPKAAPRLSPVFDLGIAAGAGAGWAGLHLLVPRLVRTSCPCMKADINVIDRPATNWHLDSNEKPAYTALGLSFASSLAALLLSDPERKNTFEEVAVVLEATMLTGMVTEGVKIAVSRPYPFMARPETHPLQNENEINYQSFWSGHTAVPMAAAAATIFILHRRGASRTWRILAWTGGALMAVVAGSLEVAGGNHYPTDVLAGGLAGAGTGVLTPWLNGM